MISIARRRVARVVALPGAALALVAWLGVQPALASSSQVCGNSGTGYCLNDWGGAGQSGDAVKMYYGGTTNDDFYVQEVNWCSGHDTVQSTAAPHHDSTNCPFANTNWDANLAGDPIVQVTYINNTTQCVATTSSPKAVLGSCANPLSGSGGANGVINVLWNQSCGAYFMNRYWTDANSGNDTFLASGNAPGNQAQFTVGGGTCWGGFNLFAP
jgi:hypothetical protein